VAIVLPVFDAFTKNDLLLSMMSTVVGDDVDLEPARKAFEATRGDFRAKFTAAVQARLAQLVVPEVFIGLPEHPEQLRKADLEKLVRQAPHGFLRSSPSKDELLDQVDRIRRRQQRRPAWIPRIDCDGKPIRPPEEDSTNAGRDPDRPLVVSALPEIGDVTVMLPTAWEDRPELVMAAGGIGEWESTLFASLGLAREDSPASTVTIDAAANEALVPDEERWWSPESPPSVPATQDPGVASELLATSATLGGLPVTDNTPEAYEAMADALASAGDWRYGPRWLLESWAPGDDTAALVVAQAAVAGWADEHRSGVIVYVYGGALYRAEGLVGVPGPLHSYLLAVTRSADSTDNVAAVHRVTWSCPGEHWCHRGGCPDVDFLELAALFTPIVTAAHTAYAALDSMDGGWADSHRQLYGDGEGPDYIDRVLDMVTGKLSGAGWVELEESTWEGGLEQSLLRRGEHCLVAAYDPVTRQVQLTDGKDELELTLQVLADDGVLIGDDAGERVDTSEAAVEQWGTDLLTAANDLLQGRINTLPQLTAPVQITMLGLHPHADGTLRSPQAATLADRQLSALLDTIGLLATREA
jgi:hypothetical protein